jgi:hypothetical protein
LLAFLLLAAQSPREKEIAALPPCKEKRVPQGADWRRLEPRAGFAIHLPACFEPVSEAPRFVHGGNSWRCGGKRAEVVWGMWTAASFESREQCRTVLAGVPALVVLRKADGGGSSALVWYLTGQVHEPILSAFSDSSADSDLVAAIAQSVELSLPRAPSR